MKRSVFFVLVALVAGLLLALSPAASADPVIHKVSVGSADIVPPPGTDANFSLSATQRADGTVKGQWQDTFFGRGIPAAPIHVAITCLSVAGNQAWVSGLITHVGDPALAVLGYVVGAPAITTVVDNGTSANDPADQVSFTSPTGSATDCQQQPVLPLFDLINGQVTVR